MARVLQVTQLVMGMRVAPMVRVRLVKKRVTWLVVTSMVMMQREKSMMMALLLMARVAQVNGVRCSSKKATHHTEQKKN